MLGALALLLAEGGHQLRRQQGCCRSWRSGTRPAGALLVGDIVWVAVIGAKKSAVVLVVPVLLLDEKDIGGVGDETAAGVSAAVLVVLGASLVGDIGWVARVAAGKGAVILVVIVLLLVKGGQRLSWQQC